MENVKTNQQPQKMPNQQNDLNDKNFGGGQAKPGQQNTGTGSNIGGGKGIQNPQTDKNTERRQ